MDTSLPNSDVGWRGLSRFGTGEVLRYDDCMRDISRLSSLRRLSYSTSVFACLGENENKGT